MLHSSVVFLPLVFFSEDGIKVTGNFPDPFENSNDKSFHFS